MTITIDLPVEVQDKLKQSAQDCGQNLNDYLRDALTDLTMSSKPNIETNTLLDLANAFDNMLTDKDRDAIPTDLSKNYRHYLYGSPKQ